MAIDKTIFSGFKCSVCATDDCQGHVVSIPSSEYSYTARALTESEITAAVEQAYQHPVNLGKLIDKDLCSAIVGSILKAQIVG